ncbi:sensor protein EvgS precursor [Desulfosporosinus acididurans]|uniref:Stage 0 sporulation protein A homolog n=1 Tax=Desulfosporosinus acididurans TaxID=476652 RepID=A0A0J1FLH2_9FIRM|nr:sensor protein EvgS precursor [Desulfosporosinus acididurans]
MLAEVFTIDTKDNSYLISSASKVTQIGSGFLELTEYSKDELESKDISEVFTGLLRLSKKKFEQIDIKDNIECYIFTKSFEVREVIISVLSGRESNNLIYTVIEKPNSRLDDKLIFEEQLFKDNIVGCSIYSVPDLILLKSNEKYLEFMDQSYNTIEKCIGLSLWESVPGYMGSNSEQLFLTIMKTGMPQYYNEFKYDHYERGITYWDGSVVPIFSNGNLKYIYQTCTEITEKVATRNQIEEQIKIIESQNIKLNQQNELFKRHLKLLDLSTEAIFAWDLNGAITYWNKGAEMMYGFSHKEAVGCVSHELLKTVHFGITDNIISMLERDGYWNGIVEHTTKDGRKLIIETRHQVILADRGKHIVLETNHDVTERKRVEEKVRESEERFRAVQENSLDRFTILKPFYNYQGELVDFTYVYQNVQAAITTGHKPEELVGLRMTEVWPTFPQTRFFTMYKEAVETGQVMEFEECYHADGIDDWFRATVTHIPEGIAIATQIITERKKAEAALRESEKNAHELIAKLEKADHYKNQFISSLSHELRNPLASMMMSLSLLKLAAPDSEQASQAKEIFERQTIQLSRLVDDLLEVTRISQNMIKLKIEQIELNNLILKTVKDFIPMYAEKGVNLEWNIFCEPIFLQADPARLTQVIGNLLHNALKFTGKDGKTQVNVFKDEKSNKAVITVKDNGLGIKPEQLPDLFQPFIQADTSLDRSSGGLGLGLAIVKGMVELHGGNVIGHSDGLGKGSEFVISLPLLTKQESKNEIKDHTENNVKFFRRILVIDDIEDVAEIICSLLRFLGHEVISAPNGIKGLSAAKDFKPDVVFCDIGLPGMNGYEVARNIRLDNQLKGIYLIALSGYAQPEDLKKSMEAGFNCHLAKPLDLEKLKEMLNLEMAYSKRSELNNQNSTISIASK